jgi:hypothetical protein
MPEKAGVAVKPYICIQEVLHSNFDRDIDYPE